MQMDLTADFLSLSLSLSLSFRLTWLDGWFDGIDRDGDFFSSFSSE